MNANDYQQKALATARSKIPDWAEGVTEEGRKIIMVSNWAFGIIGETGEFIEFLKKMYFHGKSISRDVLLSELGDILWYLVVLMHYLGFTLEEVMEHNAEKLEARYPEGFTPGGGIREDDPAGDGGAKGE